MVGLTREQRAAKAAQAEMTRQAEPPTEAVDAPPPAEVLMEKDGKTATVRNGPSVAIMQAAGWILKA